MKSPGPRETSDPSEENTLTMLDKEAPTTAVCSAVYASVWKD